MLKWVNRLFVVRLKRTIKTLYPNRLFFWNGLYGWPIFASHTQHMEFSQGGLDKDTLLHLYHSMLLPRLIEEKMLLLLRKGEVSKWFSGIGQEAVSVGATAAMLPDEYIMPLHRNLGVFTTRNMPLPKLFAQWMGKATGYSNGRERSFHFGANEHHICGMISHLGPQLSVAAGVALAHKLRGDGRCSLAFTGDGGTSEGEFHEALNMAAVWRLPVIFLIENNGYGLSTPTRDQYACENLWEKAGGYGMEGLAVDGNNIVEVYETIGRLAKDIRCNPRPVLVECKTFRMRGHEEASGTKYVPKELLDYWATKDPVTQYESWLIQLGVLTGNEIDEAKMRCKAQIDKGLKDANVMPWPELDTETELRDVYKPLLSNAAMLPTRNQAVGPDLDLKNLRLVDACAQAIDQALDHWPNLVIMGQDIAEYGGVFKVTEGLMDKYGSDRVRNTPICESAVVGIALGLSIKGMKSIVEMQFSDFVSCAFTQIVNNMAKIYYRWGQAADVVVRMPTGAGVGAGPFHSQSTEAWFAHTPGLKVVYPSNPFDAKGLLLASLQDPNPVMFFEHKALYRSITGKVPSGLYTIPIGKANRLMAGNDLSIITYGMGVHWATEALATRRDIEAELIDLRTLLPWDKEMVAESVKKTGKVLVLTEDTESYGIGSELAAWIGQHLFEYLDGPIVRVCSLDTPVPFNVELEKQFLAKSRLLAALDQLFGY